MTDQNGVELKRQTTASQQKLFKKFCCLNEVICDSKLLQIFVDASLTLASNIWCTYYIIEKQILPRRRLFLEKKHRRSHELQAIINIFTSKQMAFVQAETFWYDKYGKNRSKVNNANTFQWIVCSHRSRSCKFLAWKLSKQYYLSTVRHNNANCMVVFIIFVDTIVFRRNLNMASRIGKLLSRFWVQSRSRFS